MSAAGQPIAGRLTERQPRWYATVRSNIAARTGRSLDAWVAIARRCPRDEPRERADWLRTEPGRGVNHAALGLSEASPSAGGRDDPGALRAALAADAGSRANLAAIGRVAAGVTAVVAGQRKSFTAFSRDLQFAAARPLKGGRARRGPRRSPDALPRLGAARRKDSGSQRLTATVELDRRADVDDEIARLFTAAAANGWNSRPRGAGTGRNT